MQHQPDTPEIKTTDWIRAIPHLLAIGLAGFIVQALNPFHDWLLSFIIGWLLIIGYRYMIRYTITKQHVKGLRLVQAQRFREATDAFQKSLAFFEQHPKLDKWRSIIFLSPGKYGYQEMALLNLGYVYGQLGEGEKAEQYYHKALEMNPNNGAAKAALNLLNAKQSINGNP